MAKILFQILIGVCAVAIFCFLYSQTASILKNSETLKAGLPLAKTQSFAASLMEPIKELFVGNK